jgi:hypothetical protein
LRFDNLGALFGVFDVEHNIVDVFALNQIQVVKHQVNKLCHQGLEEPKCFFGLEFGQLLGKVGELSKVGANLNEKFFVFRLVQRRVPKNILEANNLQIFLDLNRENYEEE